MQVPGHEEVDAVIEGEVAEQLPVVRGREVGDDDLPVGRGVGQVQLEPLHLLLPEGLKPAVAVINVGRTTFAGAVGTGFLRVVRVAAYVVGHVLERFVCIVHVRVQEKIVDGKSLVVDSAPPILGGCEPPLRPVLRRLLPRVHDRLVPAVAVQVAAVVVVPEDAEPRDAVEALAGVLVLEDALPLGGEVGHVQSGRAAPSFHSAPVEIVSDVEDVLWTYVGGPLSHPVSDRELRDVVQAGHELPLVKTVFPMVCRHRLRLPHLGVGREAAPVADDEDVVLVLIGVDARVWQLHAVQGQSNIPWSGGLELVVAPVPVHAAALAGGPPEQDQAAGAAPPAHR
mmetsp:Transcript_7831/g.21014  ORF Transcript_7831/g.21014 Transcript_7831/m.21014 type:complete len:340 (+) Transcript_7831:1085-2104(+)